MADGKLRERADNDDYPPEQTHQTEAISSVSRFFIFNRDEMFARDVKCNLSHNESRNAQDKRHEDSQNRKYQGDDSNCFNFLSLLQLVSG